MTFSLGLLSLFGGSLSIRWRFAFEEFYSDFKSIPIKSLLVRVLKYTFIIELLTALVLLTQFARDFPLDKAIEHSVFHAVSAFCNAGFSTFPDNLEGYRNNIEVTINYIIIY